MRLLKLEHLVDTAQCSAGQLDEEEQPEHDGSSEPDIPDKVEEPGEETEGWVEPLHAVEEMPNGGVFSRVIGHLVGCQDGENSATKGSDVEQVLELADGARRVQPSLVQVYWQAEVCRGE